MNRAQWAEPVHDIVALRRARARAALNRRRQELARARRRTLARLLREEGFDPSGNLAGAGTEALVRRYFLETGASRATLFRDLTVFKAAGRFGSRAVQALLDDTGTSEQDQKRPDRSVRLARLAALAAGGTPCPTCGRLRGLPARTAGGPIWYGAYYALSRAVAELPAAERAYVRERAAGWYRAWVARTRARTAHTARTRARTGTRGDGQDARSAPAPVPAPLDRAERARLVAEVDYALRLRGYPPPPADRAPQAAAYWQDIHATTRDAAQAWRAALAVAADDDLRALHRWLTMAE